MQTCSLCNATSRDNDTHCVNCGALLSEYSTAAVALKKFQNNPRVRDVRVVVPASACPVCRSFEGTYNKEEAPKIPFDGCSEPDGCRAFYEPMLLELYP